MAADVSLVTGGAGFMGSHVTEHLLAAGQEVIVLDDLSGGFATNVPAGAEFVQGSICDADLVNRLFATHRFRFVYHLAAYAAEGLSHFIKRFNYLNNLVGSVTLINAAVNYGAECFVFTSSIAVYGSGQSPLSEEMLPVPEDSYGIAKLAVERELEVSRSMFGLDYVIFRPHNVYGERQNIGDRYRNVVGIFMNQILSGEPMTVFGDGSQIRAFTHVDDVAPVIARSVQVEGARGKVFNLGSDEPYTVTELATVVAAAMGVPCRVTNLAPRHEVHSAFSQHSKLDAVFGKQRNIPLETGIARMAEWVRAHGARRSSVFEGIEISKGLPPSWQQRAAARS